MEVITNECIDYKHRHLTGYFRDGVRRIDLVLVSCDTKIEEVELLKMNFLTNVMNGGMELEVERGVLPKNQNVNFIKIHTPAYVLKHFGFYYSLNKYYKLNHLDQASQCVQDERDIITIIRADYPEPTNYSTYERSLITYKILQSITYGEYENYVGVKNLLERRVFLDLYALHDGPHYFVLRQKTAALTGRQALMMTWVGYRNLYRQQPVHLIREYLGERIGFFFAFYEFYNVLMFIAGCMGVGLFCLSKFDLSSREKIIDAGFNEAHTYHYKQGSVSRKYTDFPLCPKCRDFVGCPFRYMKEYSREVSVKMRIDTPWNYLFSLFFIFIAIAGTVYWRRKENYLNWLWEIQLPDVMSTRRPDYVENMRTRRKVSILTKIKKFTKNIMIVREIIQFIVMVFFLALYFLVILPALIVFMQQLWNRYRYIEEEFDASAERPFKATSITMFVLALVNAWVIVVMERIWFVVAKWLTTTASVRTEKQYEETLSTNLFTYWFIVNFGLILFVAFIKGLFYTHPGDATRWPMALQLGMMNCGMLKCLDELFVLYVATFRCKLFIEEFVSILEGLHHKSDAAQTPLHLEFGTVPCWEREYPLQPLTEDFFVWHICRILIEFIASLLFVTVFPLAPAIVFLVNMFKIRYLAKVILLHSRRPLMLQSWGLGSWRRILLAIPFILALVHAVHLARNGHVIDKNFNARHFKHLPARRYFADFYLAYFDMSHPGSDDGVKKEWATELSKKPTQPIHFRENEFEPVATKDMVKYDTKFSYLHLDNYSKLWTTKEPAQEKPQKKGKKEKTKTQRVKNYYYTKELLKPHFCMFEGHLQRLLAAKGGKSFVKVNSYTAEPVKYYLHWHQSLFVFAYGAIVAILGLLLYYCVPSKSDRVKRMKYAEEYIKEYHFRALKDKTEPPGMIEPTIPPRPKTPPAKD